MRTPKATGINPKILRWARENAGFTIEEIAKKMKKDVEVWENGDELPTFKQLSNLSNIYRYPSAFFFDDVLPPSETITC